jgi:hypothetical protein
MTTLPFSQRPTETPRAVHRDDVRRDVRPRGPEPPLSGPRRPGALAAGTLLLALAAAACGLLYWNASPGPPATGALRIESDPAGAAVEISGGVRGITPTTLHLAPGTHRVMVNHGGQTHSFAATVIAGTIRTHHVRWTAPPEPPRDVPARARLNISSEPAGGAITVDGTRRGTTPLALDDLTPGTHDIAVRLDGRTHRRTVVLAPGASESISITATRAPAETGLLVVRSSTPLQVFEAGRLVGTTDADRIRLPAGSRELEFVADALGFRARRTVTIPAGGTAQVPVSLPEVTVSLNATPWADVSIDGRTIGQTPIANHLLALGSHRITFRHPQFGERTETLTVSLREPARLAVDMRR